MAICGARRCAATPVYTVYGECVARQMLDREVHSAWGRILWRDGFVGKSGLRCQEEHIRMCKVTARVPMERERAPGDTRQGSIHSYEALATSEALLTTAYAALA